MASEDEIARAYARWHVANERYKELDKQFKETEDLLRQARDATHSILESRQRTPREILEEQIQQALLPIEARYEAAVEAAEAEYDTKISMAEEEYERDHAAIMTSFEVRLAELGDPEDEDEQIEWTSPEYEAAERSEKQISKELEELRQLRLRARHELNEAREIKKNLR